MSKIKKADEDRTVKEKEIWRRAEELTYDTDRFGPGSLMTQADKVNSSRAIMLNHHMTQFVSIKDPEMPLIPTGFEKVLGGYSSMNEQLDANYEIVAKFIKNQYNYVLIGFDKRSKVYHAWKRQEADEHSEGSCTRYNNQFIDSLEPGDHVKRGQFIKKSANFDKDMNYCSGKNLNVVYMVSAQVLEDGIQVMNGADQMMNTFHMSKLEINLADNEILLNWNGNDKEYRGLPKIGEKTKNGILCAVRRVDNSKAPFALKKKRLQQPELGDRLYYGKGRVIDIDIRYNKERDNISDIGANHAIKEMYDKQQSYYRELVRFMMNIRNVSYSGEGDFTYTDEFSMILQEAMNYVDGSTYFADNNGNVFSNMMITVTLMNEEKLIVGSKLVGRCGNKGVITKIIPPEKSWHMEDGRPIHLVVAALGVVGRLNPAQLNEHSLNELGNTVVEMMKTADDVDKKAYYVYRLLTFVNAKEAKGFRAYFASLDPKDRKKFCRRIEREGIVIIQEPINNANILDLAKAYEQFPANYQKIVFPDGKKSIRKVLCAKMFYYRLKQDPLDKYSLRSRGPTNPLTNSPAKSNQKKKGLAPISDVAVRFGEYEIEVILANCNHPEMVARFMAENSTSWPAKMVIAEQTYMGEPNGTVDISEVGNVHEGKKNMEAIQAYLNVLGTQFEIEVEKAKPGEYFND